VIPVWAAIAVPSLAGLFLVVAHANSIGQQNALVGLRFAGEIKLHPTRRRVTRITDTRSSAVDHCLRIIGSGAARPALAVRGDCDLR
jgi:hypothetical protein